MGRKKITKYEKYRDSICSSVDITFDEVIMLDELLRNTAPKDLNNFNEQRKALITFAHKMIPLFKEMNKLLKSDRRYYVKINKRYIRKSLIDW